jgi:hypothetical protein
LSTDFPGGIDTFTNPTSTDTLDNPSHSDQHADVNDAIEAIETWVFGGTSFPVSPSTGQRFYRSDRDIEYFYDGTRWLSTAVFSYPLPIADATLPISATNGALHRAAYPYAGVYGIYIERAVVSFHVASGGTALGASHKWVGTLIDSAASTVYATINVDSGSSGIWRNTAPAVLAAVSSGSIAMQVGWTKTGTPGGLYALVTINYRLVG